MSDRFCTKRGQVILPNLEGNLCSKCLDSRPYLSKFYYDTRDMSQILGISQKQVCRKARKGELPRHVTVIRRYLWLKSVVDQWINEGQPIPRISNRPIQEKAFTMYKEKDHSWMSDEVYTDNSYFRKSQVDVVKTPYLSALFIPTTFAATVNISIAKDNANSIMRYRG